MEEKTNNHPLNVEAQFLDRQIKDFINQGSSNERACLEITGFCPGNCLICYAAELAKRNMDKPLIKTSLEAFSKNKIKESYITGGEPNLSPNVLYTLEKAKELGIRTILVTTGYKLDNRENAEKVIGLCDAIEISIRDNNPDVHNNVILGKGWVDNKVTEKPKFGSFETAINAFKVLDGLRKELGLDFKLGINFDLNSTHKPDTAVKILDTMKDYGIEIDNFNIQLLAKSGRAKGLDVENLQASKELFISLLENVVNKYGDKVEIEVTDDPYKLGILKENEMPDNLKKYIVGEVVLAIAPDGKVRRNIIEC